jgi:hypothetical protein
VTAVQTSTNHVPSDVGVSQRPRVDRRSDRPLQGRTVGAHRRTRATYSSATDVSGLLPVPPRYLVEANAVPRYYLRKETTPDQWTSTYFIEYRDKTETWLSGEPGYRAAIRDAYFDVIVLNWTVTKELDDKLFAELRTSDKYRLLGKLPYRTSYGEGYYHVWAKRRPRKRVQVLRGQGGRRRNTHAGSAYWTSTSMCLGLEVAHAQAGRRHCAAA